MILDTIILENFGAYGGRQEALLTPEEGKPIILFGGMNGGGDGRKEQDSAAADLGGAP